MKKYYQSVAHTICIVLLLIAAATRSMAQVTGTKTIGTDYPTLAAAISDLNTVGISGAVIINVPAGYAETAPTGGYVLGSTALNATTSVSNTLTIQKSGSGANPLLTAFTGTSTSTDGIFILRGTDYVSINGIDLTESAANTTATTRMEWGYALVKLQAAAPFDGCQNVTIQNCVITLNRLNTTTVGIYANNHIATATTALSITATTDAMNNCRFYGNTVLNSVYGISLRGYAGAASPYTLYDQNNDIGGSTGATGNTIQNFAGATSGAGINLQYQNNANISYNSIDNIAATGVPSTVTLYGIYVQNGTNTTVNATNNNILLTQGTTSSASYDINISSAGTGTATINSNILSANGGSTGSMYMIYLGGANTNVVTNNNVFYNINVATTATLALIYHSAATSPEFITCNNNQTGGPTTPYVTKTGAGGSVYGYYNNSGSTSGAATITGNNFSWFNLAGSPTFYGLNETNGGSGQAKLMANNTISNVTSVGGSLYGLRMGFAASVNFTNNTVTQINAGTGSAYGVYVLSGTTDTVTGNSIHGLTSTGGSVYGIYVGGGTTVNVYGDTVYNLSTSATSGAGYGIYQSSGTTVNIYQNKLYDIAATGSSGSVNGIYLSSGTTTVYNNLVGDLRTPTFSGAAGTQLAGIYVNGGTAHNIYYNSVYLNATSTGADFGSSAIYSSTTPALTLRNNIFVNNSVPNGAGVSAAYRRNGTTLTSYQSASNNNLFYAGNPGPSNIIFTDGTTVNTTLAAYKAFVAPRDVNSVTENPTFISTSGPSASFLHISASVPTQIESGGANITGITTDIDGIIRAGNPGYAGTGSAPDIGADEGDFPPTDLSAPAIIYTALTSACGMGDRTLTATITDATGVPTSGTLVPRIYYKKNSGSWLSAPGTLASGTATSGVWNFTISASAMGGLAVADTVSYFVIAQDVTSAANIGSNPPGGLAATDVNTISSYPTTPNSYVVLPTLSGTYNVGTGMAYATITDAVNAYNTSCISGPVVFQLMDATYPSETFPITINNNISSGGGNTLTIRPAAGVAPTISGSASAIFLLNGADYVTIEGSNAPVTNSICPLVSSTRDLTITNTSTSTTSAVIWIQTTTGGDSAVNNSIRDCNISGNGATQTLAGVGSGSATISSTSTGTGNHNNRIENNSITKTQIGIYSSGKSATQKNNGTVINQNVMTASAPNSISRYGILTGFENGLTISANSIGNVVFTGSGDVSAISAGIGFGNLGNTVTTGNEVTNATITYNKIDSFIANNAWSDAGIAIAGAASGTNTIANNMISRVLGHGTGGDITAGIYVGGVAGGTTNVLYNTVNLSGTLTGATYPSFGIAISGSNPLVTLNNNIFINTSSNGSSYPPYAIGLAYSAYTNLNSNYNDFYTSGSAMGAVGTLSGGGDQATLAAWQATTGKDAASKNVNPAFASAGDMHLALVVTNVPLDNTATPTSITTDIDCDARGSTPDIGADEVTIPSCSGAVAGTVAPATGFFCGTGVTTVTATGASTSLGIAYQWQSSTDSASWSPIAGATNTSYVISPAITDTTYYRFVVTCTITGVADSATTKVIVNPLPTTSVTPDGGGYCSGSGGSVTMTASGAVSYTWAPGAGLTATTGASVTASPAATTAYTVTGTDAAGCIGTHVSTVTVTSTPPTVIVTPMADTVCAGSALPLTATSTLPDTVFQESFNSGLGAWTVDNTGTTATIASTQWQQHADGYVYGTTTFHSPDASGFVMANSDAGGSGLVVHTSMTSPTFSLAGYTSATLTFKHYYRYISSDVFAKVEISTDGGSTWATLHDYRADAVTVGGPTAFGTATIDLATYLGQPNCKIRYNYSAGWGWYWAVDGVAITGAGSYTNITWTPTTGLYNDAALTTPYTGAAMATVYASPTAPSVITYTATVTNGACSSTGTTTVTTVPAPTAFAVAGGGTYCAGSAGVHIGLGGSETGVTYQLYNGSTPTGTAIAGSGGSIDFGLLTTAGTYSVLATNTTTGCANAMTGSVTITASPLPAAFALTGGGSYCAGGAGISVGLSGSETGVNYQLYNGSAATGGPIAGTGTAIDFSLQTAAGTYSVLATNVTTGCQAGMTGTATIIVDPLPAIFTVTGGGSYCSGGAGVHIGLSGSQTGINYQLYSSSAIGTPVAGTGGALDFGLQTAAGTYSVIATNATTSCTNNMGGFVTVAIDPLPTVFAVTGGGTRCSDEPGVHVGLSGSEIGIDYRLYRGVIALSPTVSGTGSALDFGAFTPGGTYTVRATSGAGCTASMSGSAVITTFLVPVAYTISGGGSYCAGDSGVHVIQSGSTFGISYQLYNGPIAVGPPRTGTTFPIDYGLQTAAGTYSVVATNPTTGCNSDMTGTATVTVQPLPTIFSVTGGGSYCLGGDGVLIGVSGSETGVNYQLYDSAGATGAFISGTGGPISFGLQTATGTYTVLATNATTGCSQAMTGSAPVSTTPLPGTFSVTGGGAYCAGGAGVSVGLSGSEPGVNYQLYNGGTAIGSPIVGTGAALDFGLQTAAGSYSVAGTSTSTGCTAAMTGTATVFINPTEPPSVSIISSGGDTICASSVITFTAVPTNGGLTPTYQWSVNGVNTGTGSTFTYIPSNGDVVRVVITSSSCASPDTASNSRVMTITSGVMPTVSIITAPGTTVCEGTTVTLSAASTYGGTDPQYLWTKNGINVATGPSYILVPDDGDVIHVTLISNYACAINDSVVSSYITLHVVPTITPSVYIVAHPGTVITPGQSDTLVAFASNAGSSPTFQWSVNGANVPGATSSTFVSSTLHNNDTVRVVVTSSGTCAGLTATNSVVIYVFAVGVDQPTTGIDVTLQPNPNKGIFSIRGTVGSAAGDARIQVADMLGQVVYEGTAQIRNGAIEEQISLNNNLANGMYLLHLMVGTDKRTFHFEITR